MQNVDELKEELERLEIDLGVLAQEIELLAEGLTNIRKKAGLSKRAILLLLHDAVKGKVRKQDINLILESGRLLKALYLEVK